MEQTKIKKYYDRSLTDYHRFWDTNQHGAMHYGYYDDNHQQHHRAINNRCRVLAKQAQVTEDDVVLDVGCGLGGSAFWLANHTGARIVGIDINENHIRQAQKMAVRKDVDDRVEFKQMDFTDMDYSDERFSLIIGIESICHAEDKSEFLSEAYDVLTADGRIIISDGFRTTRDTSYFDEKLLQSAMEGWAVPDLDTVEEFTHSLCQQGFENITFKDIKDNIMPSARKLFFLGLIGWPVSRLLQSVHISDSIQTKNARTAVYQYIVLKKKIATQCTILAEKASL